MRRIRQTRRHRTIAAAFLLLVASACESDQQLDPDRELFRVERFEVGNSPQDVAVQGTTAWVTLAEDRSVVRLEALTGNQVGDPQPVGEVPAGIAIGFGSVWVGFGEGATVVRLDQGSGTVLNDAIVSGRNPHAIAIGEDDVWVAAIGEGRVSRIDPNEVVNAAAEIFTAGGRFPSDVAYGFGKVWVTDVVTGKVVVIDPKNPKRKQRSVKVGESPNNVAVGDDAIWVTNQNFGDGTLNRIDPETLKVTDTIEIGDEIAGLDTGEGYVWITLSEIGRVARVGQDSRQLEGVPILTQGTPLGIDVADGHVWVADGANGDVVRIQLNAQLD